jgi:hypothetical protein
MLSNGCHATIDAMESKKQPSRVNLETQESHRKQFQLQILLPVLLGSVVLLAAGGLAAVGSGDRPAVWADISTIFIAILFGLGGILQLGGLLLLVFGAQWVQKNLPGGSYLVQAYLTLFSSSLKRVDDKISSPWISIRASWAGIRRIFKR